MRNNLIKYLLQNKNKSLINTEDLSYKSEKELHNKKIEYNLIINYISYNIDLSFDILDYKKVISNSSHTNRYMAYVNIKNKVTNSFGTISFRNIILYKNSIGRVNTTYKEEKFGNYLLSKKLQRYLLVHKFTKPHLIHYVTVLSTGIRRFFRASLGHITQMCIKLVKRYQYVIYRYSRWVLKFLRITRRLKRPIMLTYRQRSHTTWLRHNILNRRRQTLGLYQIRLLTSYSNNIPKVSKRKGKFNFGY